ncbi:hypothetical protein A11M_0106925 [Xanthomonas vasicola pv. vasculorum NCPPB 895]|uniref:hypothetical protein n=2 Tax=Xanthomonas vasicola TaxID=56459 RepID=UPI0004D81C3B|nr:hypothetical protein [Xanthomonas vasicola]KEZ98222.1 hypothetical protein A11M_0106925 [Xanthomonas vasicola pv. vasculorum NCPPB 895]MDO6934576.1 hypothetical protein [Xanthomonas vasicola]MDO6938239.1 hypothetical protein [Xanthomonas vasicola]
MSFVSSSKQLARLPSEVRLAHYYCFYLHDAIARMFVEYEAANAMEITVNFAGKSKANEFMQDAKRYDPITALRNAGLHTEAKHTVLNAITMAMSSDCAHHIYEALKCFEKRKVIPGFSLLRKPLLDNLSYFSWMVADENGFYDDFTCGDVSKITQKKLGNRRIELIESAIKAIKVEDLCSAQQINDIIFNSKNDSGLYGYFQHALHLVTVERLELKTSPENFNFIFKNPNDDDVYFSLYSVLPLVIFYLARVVMHLFEKISPMDPVSKAAFTLRSQMGLLLLRHKGAERMLHIFEGISETVECFSCGGALKITARNVERIVLTETVRCTKCRRINGFPFDAFLTI